MIPYQINSDKDPIFFKDSGINKTRYLVWLSEETISNQSLTFKTNKKNLVISKQTLTKLNNIGFRNTKFLSSLPRFPPNRIFNKTFSKNGKSLSSFSTYNKHIKPLETEEKACL